MDQGQASQCLVSIDGRRRLPESTPREPMPRPRQKALFELAGQWIGNEVGKPGLYRYWHDAATGHSRRASLGTADFEQAKKRLAEIVVRGAVKNSDSHLSVVLEDYFLNKTDHLVTKGTARNAGRLMLECWGGLVLAGDLTDTKQKTFVKWSLSKNHALSTIARNLGVLAAALRHAKLDAEVIYSEGAILSKWPEIKPKAPREIFEPSDEELARLLRAPIPDDLRRWLLNSMATGGRPEAVLGFGPNQRQRDVGLIDLNPKGRRQNKKFRATVRELPVQTEWLDAWETAAAKTSGEPQRYCAYTSVDSLDTALRRWRIKPEVNVPAISVYSIRHRATSVLRAARVSSEQISFQLGHRRPSERSTRGYGEYGPHHLADAERALDAWVKRVLKLSRKKLSHKKLLRAA